MFPNAFSCFQYPIFVSNIQSMFPNENDVSKRQCFQCMFPIYMEPDVHSWHGMIMESPELDSNYLLIVCVPFLHIKVYSKAFRV